MGEMEERIGAILNDPNMMQQIMTMAQSLGQNTPAQEPAQKEPSQGNSGKNSIYHRQTRKPSPHADFSCTEAKATSKCPTRKMKNAKPSHKIFSFSQDNFIFSPPNY